MRASSSHGLAVIFTAVTTVTAWAQGVVINEIHYDPPDKTSWEEFVELYNDGAEAVDISGWFFSSAIDFVFPSVTTIAPGGYLVVAADPDAFLARFGKLPDQGPFEGRLDGDGERLTLRDSRGGLVDEVEYAVRFPWPIAPAGSGCSMELIHPSLDNNLGGSWRASGTSGSQGGDPVELVPEGSDAWRYRKGTSEASSPTDAWRAVGFVEDGTWLDGTAGFGYGDSDDATVLSDMQGGYWSVYLRHVFQVEDPASLPRPLLLRVYVDDGCIVWLNGTEVARSHVTPGAKPYNGSAESHEAVWEEIQLPASAAAALRAGDNVLAVHALNATLDSSDFSIDAALIAGGSGGEVVGEPTPGQRNSVYASNAPPQVRQVDSAPLQPLSGTPFVVLAKVTDPEGVSQVTVRYQVVRPGSYVPAYLPLPVPTLIASPFRARDRNPAFEDPASWTEVAMRDDGVAPDAIAGDDEFAATIPGQENRTLVRYRIAVEDSLGASVTVPYADDPSLNFAAFVYDGVPGYEITTRTVHPDGVGHVYPIEVMNSLPVYFLITRAQDLRDCIAADASLQIPQGTEARFIENWEGAFVYEGRVHDHINYRLRGANGRYQVPLDNPANVAGKRHYKLKFNRGNYLRARDRFGNLYPSRWRDLVTGRMFGNRIDGNWSLSEQVNDIIWMAHGVPSTFGHSFHFRVIDGPDEAPSGTNGQYLGDFWGIAQAIENYDVEYLDAHGLPKGNLYKLVNQTNDAKAQQRYQAPYAVSDGSDHNNIEYSLRPTQSAAWLNAHVNYPQWYRYHAICQAVRNYDYWPDANKNAAWYFEPIYTAENHYYGIMWTFPFDTDATWGPTWNAGQDRPYDAIYGGGGKPDFQRDYRSAIREVRDLLFQRDQLELVIRQVASFMDALEEPDIDRWRLAPAEAGRQYFSNPRQATLAGKIKDMLDFAFVGGSWDGGSVGAGGQAKFLDSLADGVDKTLLPATPTVTYTGAADCPVDGLTFRSSAFSDPQGADTFGGMEWRIAEVSAYGDASAIPLSDPVWKYEPVRLEITPVWTSGELPQFQEAITIPPERVEPDRTYRVRVRMKDATGRWSHWSAPVEFTAGPPREPPPAVSALRVTELMFHPPEGNDLEFVELLNTGDSPLELDGVAFTRGIEFRFDDSDVHVIAPGEYVVVVGNLQVFWARYGTKGITVAGQFSGNLSNTGEQMTLSVGAYATVLDFQYDDLWYPRADGLGRSIEIVDPEGPAEAWSRKTGWRESAGDGGTPGAPPVVVPQGGLQLIGDANQDGRADISDGVTILTVLFLGSSSAYPCEGSSAQEGGNLAIFDVNADELVNITDPIYLLNWLFLGGPEPPRGTECQRIEGCPDACVEG